MSDEKDGGVLSKAESKKIKMKLSVFEITNILCKILRTDDNEFTRKLDKRIKKAIQEKLQVLVGYQPYGDWVNAEEIKRWRNYGVTGIELGIQSTDDKVNEFCKRGHGIKESIAATKLCRDVGLKICHHLMPNLPSSTLKSDLRSGKDLFKNEGLRPDYLKIYPCMVTPFSELAKQIKEDPDFHKP